ncbi:FAD-dependent oxidoreductase [Candidatus Pelagibacter sp.]|nr:FAD-dependent oxidoreductase [Candidatus Pelagibacter sp.]
MNIGIIGGGFYGCYLAKHLSLNNKVTIFEANRGLIMESGRYNQYRLHQGFHYPRSEETIKQTKIGYEKFIFEFKDYLYFPKYNYYCIHKNSKIDFDSYIKILKKNKLDYVLSNKNEIPHLNHSSIVGSVNTKEGVILVNKLIKKLINEIKNKCKILTNIKVQNIDSQLGVIETNKKKFLFDKIINTTYSNPNLGLKNKKFDVKYEIAGLLVPNIQVKNVPGITIMDGNYVSLYPRSNSTFSLSSVKYTPIKKFTNLNNKEIFIKEFKKKNNIEIAKKKIFNHCIQFLSFKKKIILKDSKFEIALKTKITNDINDIRITDIIHENKVISVLCGKLDTAPLIYEKIKKLI